MQILGDLLDNARKFTEPGGAVQIVLQPDAASGWAEFHVIDSGAGIEPEMAGRLFEPLSQADRSLHRTKGGLGLGLALVKGLTELHGGQVQARSEGKGRGAEFRVRLPLAPEPAALAEMPDTIVAVPRSKRVLIIEDNRDAADTLRLLLVLLGHDVRVAYTGPDGVQAAAEWLPNIIVSDIGLPGLDGYGVARQLRSNPATAGVKLIAVTGYGGDDDRQRARESGFDYVITKPAQPAVLMELLSNGV
jgi:CheY-like chemotaxis protein